MSFARDVLRGLFFITSIACGAATAQPTQLNHCDGVHEFYGNPSPASDRGFGLRILFYIGERENILECFENTRGFKVAPLDKELADNIYREADEQLLRHTAEELDIKDPYLANGGI